MRFPIGIALVVLTAVAVGQSGGRGRDRDLPPDLPGVLRKAIGASKTIRYSGERVVTFRARGERHEHREYILRDGPRTRVEFPEDSRFRGQVIVEDESERRHYFPDKNEIHVLPPRGEETVRRLLDMVRRGKKIGLRFEESAGGDIAGTSTRLVSFIDKHGNVLQRIWIEPNSGVMLRRQLYDRTGNVMGGFDFVRVNFKPKINRSDFVIDRKGAMVVTQADLARRFAAEHDLTFRTLPPSSGYRIDHVRMLRRSSTPVLVTAYTGRQGRFVVFQSRTELDSRKIEDLTRGEANSVVFRIGGETFVLVGDVPKTTLEELAAIFKDS